jgi:hypothetical protein
MGTAVNRDYLVEELAVICLRARALPSVKLYPGGELQLPPQRRVSIHAPARGARANPNIGKGTIRFDPRPCARGDSAMMGDSAG